MKLPDDKKTRNQVLIMIAIGTVAILYGIYALALQPFSASKKRIRADIAKLTEDLRRANAEIAQRGKDEQANVEILRRIGSASERYFLKPRLGNFILAATEVLDARVKEAGVTLTGVREIGIADISRGGTGKSSPLIRGYSAHVTMQGGYQDLTRILRVIETNNPYLTVTAVTIAGQPEKSPILHNLTFDIQWPIWSDEAIGAKILAQVRAADAAKGEQPQ